MKSACYLVLNARGVDRMTKRPPDLYAGEIAVRVTVEADPKHFRAPYVDAHIELEDRHIIRPEVAVEVTP